MGRHILLLWLLLVPNQQGRQRQVRMRKSNAAHRSEQRRGAWAGVNKDSIHGQTWGDMLACLPRVQAIAMPRSRMLESPMKTKVRFRRHCEAAAGLMSASMVQFCPRGVNRRSPRSHTPPTGMWFRLHRRII